MGCQVMPDFRRLGCGRALVATASVFAKQFGAEAIDFEIEGDQREDGVRFVKHFKGLIEDEGSYQQFVWEV